MAKLLIVEIVVTDDTDEDQFVDLLRNQPEVLTVTRIDQ